jgi:cytoskeletal protein CcmA (bactofilin family)
MRNKQSQMPNAASGNTTLISSGTTVTGDISFSGNLDIEGKVIGSISAEPGA